MKRGAIVTAFAVVLLGLVTFRLFAPQPLARHPFVTLGRGVISDTSAVAVTGVALSSETVNYDGKAVEAGPGYRYVLLDCRFVAPPRQVSFDDFQLVRERATLGQEVNVGDHGDKGYFYWTYLDASGKPTTDVPPSTSPFTARLAFKVPSDAPRAFLFYWGLYWGPFLFR